MPFQSIEIIDVGICEGDAAASLYAILNSQLEEFVDHRSVACISIGTSCQFSQLVSDNNETVNQQSHDDQSHFKLMKVDHEPSSTPSIEYRPYVLQSDSLAKSSILICATMNGGGVWQKFVNSVASQNLNVLPHKLHAKLIELGQQCFDSTIVVSPLCNAFVHQFFERERYQSQHEYEVLKSNYHSVLQSSSISLDLTTNSSFLAELAYEVTKEIICNLQYMISRTSETTELTHFSRIRNIFVAGGALQRNPLLLQHCQNIFQLPIARTSSKMEPDAAFGAALLGEYYYHTQPS
jgi:hypothetical protein